MHLCGVRGSTPAPGAEFVRYGGHTSCLALTRDGEDVPRLLLDAGTGVRSVGTLLGERAFDGTILLTHLHWDHVQGLPFFDASDRDDARAALVIPEQENGAERDRGARPRDVAAAVPDDAAGTARVLVVRDDLRRRADVRGPRGARARDPPQGRPHVRLPGHRRPHHARLHAGPLPDRARRRARTAGASTTRRHWSWPPASTCSSTTPRSFRESSRGTPASVTRSSTTPSSSAGARARARVLLFHHRPDRTDEALDAMALRLAEHTGVSLAEQGSAIDL